MKDMNYNELIEEIKRVDKIIQSTQSKYLKSDMFRYKIKLLRQLKLKE